jgi:hypothetical protein
MKAPTSGQPLPPEAWSLQAELISHYDASSKSGALNPKTNRVMHQLGFIDDESFAEALAYLLRSGDWEVPLDMDPSDPLSIRLTWTLMSVEDIKMVLLSYGVHNITQFIPTFIREATEAKDEMKAKKASLNHMKHLIRYTGKAAGLAHAMQVMASLEIRPYFQDLGYGYYKEQGFVPPHQLEDSHGRKRKICHSVWFDHPLVKAQDDEGWEQLLGITELTDDMVAKPRFCRIPASVIAAKFDLGEEPEKELSKAIQEIQKVGYFKVWVEGNPNWNLLNRTIKFTPTKQMHDAIWHHDFLAGGERLTMWEVENGHIPWSELGEGMNAHTDLPKLGYHWLYLTKSRKTGKYLTVGQTTVPLNVRKDQHMTYGSNPVIDKVIRSINEDPEDELVIECIGLVHHSVTSKWEMMALQEMISMGHRMYNALATPAENAHTIYLDARLKKMPKWKQQEELQKGLERHGAVCFTNTLPANTPGAYVEQSHIMPEIDAPF